MSPSQRLSRGLLALALSAGLIAVPSVAQASPGVSAQSAVAVAPRILPMMSASNSYELYRPDSATKPMQWLACKAINYKINTKSMPAGIGTVIKSVMKSIGKQTGVEFNYAGNTSRAFRSTSHSTKTPTIYIAFTKKSQTAGLSLGWPGTVGYGEVWGASRSDGVSMVTYGDVLLYAKFTGPKSGGGASWQSLIYHEVGHALNLEHRTSQKQVMYYYLQDSNPGKFTPTEVKVVKKALKTSKCNYELFHELS